jgi:poly-gamma-glutamate capsule biosynthesis protein CapA/YwtB (metallophosphatase superfamily)
MFLNYSMLRQSDKGHLADKAERRVAWLVRMAARLFGFPQKSTTERRVAWHLRMAARYTSF